VASLSQGRTAAAQCGLFTYKSVPVIFEPPCICKTNLTVFSTLRVYYSTSTFTKVFRLNVGYVFVICSCMLHVRFSSVC